MCYQAGFQPNIYIETSHVETVKGFVESGVGVALLSYRTASMILNSKTKIIQLTQTNNHITGLAIPKNNNLLIIKTFKDFMLNKFQSSKQTS
jgi:DNA-binding transcriptional LysR family regulator